MVKALQDSNKFIALCIAIIISVTILRIKFLFLTDLDLFFDEAQYWYWSKNLDFGFYSKPPMVATIISLTTLICGDSEACIRLGSPILHLFTAITIFFLGKVLFNNKLAAISSVTYLTLPGVTVSSLVISTDPALLFFYALSILFFYKAVRENKLSYWILTGLVAGLGLLSKYNMAFFALSAMIYMISETNYRKKILSVNVLAGASLAFIIFLPNIIWNVNNHFVSFLHTRDNANLEGPLFHPSQMLEFFGAQFGVFGPILFAVLILIFCKIKLIIKDERYKFLICFIAPMLLTMLLLSLLSRAHANWAAPVYVPASLLVVAYLYNNSKNYLSFISIFLHLIILLSLVNYNTLIRLGNIELSSKKTVIDFKQHPYKIQIKDPFKRQRGWEELGRAIKQLQQKYPNTTILTTSRKTHAELLYYVTDAPNIIIKWNPYKQLMDHFDLTTDIKDSKYDKYLFVSEVDNPENFKNYFNSHEKLDEIDLKMYNDSGVSYYIYYLEGYKLR